MADINTYTAVECGATHGGGYQISVVAATGISIGNLAAVKVTENPDVYACCTVDRSQVNQTPKDQVKSAVDSGYSLNQCQECKDHWS